MLRFSQIRFHHTRKFSLKKKKQLKSLFNDNDVENKIHLNIPQENTITRGTSAKDMVEKKKKLIDIWTVFDDVFVANLSLTYFLFSQDGEKKNPLMADDAPSVADVFIIQINVGHQSWQPVGGTGELKSAITSPNSLISQRLNERGAGEKNNNTFYLMASYL